LFCAPPLLKTVLAGTRRRQFARNNALPNRSKHALRQEDKAMMNLLEYDGHGATIQLGQRELLLVMALIQEGRESFGCDTQTGKALDQFFCSVNVSVEETRRKSVLRTLMKQKIGPVPSPHPERHKDVSNA